MTVSAFPVKSPVTFPSRCATIVPFTPEATSEVNVASGMKISLLVESSYPRNAVFAADPL